MTAEDEISAAQARALFDYCPISGELRWREHPGRKKVRPGALAGSIHSHGYRKIGIGQRRFAAHRLAWAIFHGEWPASFIDHINGDRLDNRIDNLRLATVIENARNRRPLRKDVSSKYKGVHFHKSAQKWVASTGSRGTDSYEYLGLFQNEEDAALAYNEAAKRMFGEFARLNEIENK